MKNLRKPLSVFLAVIMLFGIFAGALTTFAAGAVQEDEIVALNDSDNTFSFTPTRSGFFAVAVNVGEDLYCNFDAYAEYFDPGTKQTAQKDDIYSISNEAENKQYMVFILDQGIKYDFTVTDLYGDIFSADVKVIYLSLPEAATGQALDVDGDFAAYRFNPLKHDNYVFSVREKYLMGADYNNEAKIRILVEDSCDPENKSYYVLEDYKTARSLGSKETIDEERYNREVTSKLLTSSLNPDFSYIVFVTSGDTIDGTSFTVNGYYGSAVEIIDLDISAIGEEGKFPFGSNFPAADSVKIASLNKDYLGEEDPTTEIDADSVEITNVRFVNYDEEAEEQNENYWTTAPATNDPRMIGEYLMCFDIVPKDESVFFFEPKIGASDNNSGYFIEDYCPRNVCTEEKVSVALIIDAGEYVKNGIIYEIDTNNRTASVVGISKNQTSYNIEEKITVGDLEIPVTKIGYYAFSGTSATSITIPKTVTEICYKSLANIKAASLTIPASVKKISSAAFYGDQKLKKINVDASNANYSAANGILYNKNKTLLHTYPAGATASSITLVSSVRTVGNCAFSTTTKLKSVSLRNVSTLETAAFYDSSVENTTIPAAVKTIPESAFNGSKIKNIVILGATKIERCAFSGTTNLKEIFIPKTVTTIGEYAFSGGSALTKIVFAKGSKLASLGDFAFGYVNRYPTSTPVKGFTACYFTSDAKVRTLLNKLQKNVNAKTAIKYIPISNNNIAKCTITLGKAATFTGKNITPGIVVKSGAYVLKNGMDYTVTYSKNKLVGRAVVTITGKGSFVGKVSKIFNILPKGTKLKSVAGGKKSLTVKWVKQATQTNGYQIQYGLKKNFAGAKTIKVGKNFTSKTITNLLAGKVYYVRIRTYRTIAKTSFCSAWSGTKAVITKR